MGEIDMNAVSKSPFSVNWRPWMRGPCHACHRQLGDDESRFADFLLEKVVCEPCTYAPGRCDCPCHRAVQPGLVPCPQCP